MVGFIVGSVLLLLLGLWLFFSAFGIIVHVIGAIVFIAGAVWLFRALTNRGSNSV